VLEWKKKPPTGCNNSSEMKKKGKLGTQIEDGGNIKRRLKKFLSVSFPSTIFTLLTLPMIIFSSLQNEWMDEGSKNSNTKIITFCFPFRRIFPLCFLLA
jgi:hypothetical protein